jgi:hypothetical protein
LHVQIPTIKLDIFPQLNNIDFAAFAFTNPLQKSYSLYNDYTSKVYSERCSLYLKNLPDENWDCVFEMK